MKKFSLYPFLAIAISACSSNRLWCAEHHNNHIGKIDKLMLARAIKEQGQDAIKTKIKKQPSGSKEGSQRKPFIIWQHDLKDDNSDLSYAVFQCIANKVVFTSNNSINQFLNAQRQDLIPIDECTCLLKNNDTQDVHVASTFFDKRALTAAFNELTPTINKK